MFINNINNLYLKYFEKYNLDLLYSNNNLNNFDFINYFDNIELNNYIKDINNYIKELKTYNSNHKLNNIEQIYLNEIIELVINKKNLIKNDILYHYNIYQDSDIITYFINFIQNNNNIIITCNDNTCNDNICLDVYIFENIINKFDIYYTDLITYLNKSCNGNSNSNSNDNNKTIISDSILDKTILNFDNFIKNKYHILDRKKFNSIKSFNIYKKYEYKIDFLFNNYLANLKNYKYIINSNNINNNNFYFNNSNLIYKQFFNLYNNNLPFNDSINVKYIQKTLKNILTLFKLSTYYSKCSIDIINNITFINYLNDFNNIKKNAIDKNILNIIDNLNKNNIKSNLINILNTIILNVDEDYNILYKYANSKSNYFNNSDSLINYNKNIKKNIQKNIKQNVLFKLPFINENLWNIKLVEKNKQDINPAAYQSLTNYKKNNKVIYESNYYINPKLIKTFRKFDVYTLFLHEAIPGHVLERTYNHKYNKIPLELINDTYNSIYIEGWATFVEDLIYDLNPKRNDIIGNINYDLFRSLRLIIDMGLNYYQLFDYEYCYKLMSKLTCIDKSEIEYELNRYSVRPAQATSYILGKYEIYKLLKKYKYNKNILYYILKYGPLSFKNIDKLLKNELNKKV